MLTSWNRLPLASVVARWSAASTLLAGASFSGPNGPALWCWTEAFQLLESDTDKQSGQALITSTKGLDSAPELGSSRRSR
jgi:hypothetical protein